MRATKSRARVALVGMMLILASLLFDWLSWLLPAITYALALMGTYEIHSMGLNKGIRGSVVVPLAGTTAFIAAGLCGHATFSMLALPIVLILLVASFAAQMLEHGYEDSYRAIPLNFFSPIYVGLPLALGFQTLQYSKLFFLYTLLSVWATDSAAYGVGRALGAHKLAPNLSPKKTWEGAAGGFLGAIGIGVLFKLTLPRVAFDIGWDEMLLVSVLIAVVSQIGDLAESVLKRDAGVKDSGKAYTGHGGVLDRMDSLFFALVVAYLFLIFDQRLILFEVIRTIN